MTVAAPELVGSRTPRLQWCPVYTSSSGDDAIRLGERVGVHLDEWQQDFLVHSLAETATGLWNTPDVCLVCSRQNGKNEILMVRELAGLFLFEEELLIHTAHEMKASSVAFRRIVQLVNSRATLKNKVKTIAYSKGEEGIELLNGNRLRFMARTGNSGRSFSADFLGLDEAYNLPDHAMNALTPTLASRPNPQVWYLSSAVNQIEHPHGLTLARVRRRGIAGDDPQLFFAEYSADEDAYKVALAEHREREFAADPRNWADANPALNVPRRPRGVGMKPDFLETQLRRLGPRGFAAEHLSIGDWPPEPTTEREQVIPPEVWAELVDRMSEETSTHCFAVTVDPERTTSTISVASRRSDGLVDLEVVDERRGVAWVVERMTELAATWLPITTVLDPASQAGSLQVPLEQAGVDVTTVTAREYGQACGNFYTAATERSDEQPTGLIRHRNDDRINVALSNAGTRPLMGSWVWSLDTAPALVGVTLALHGLQVSDGNDGTVTLW